MFVACAYDPAKVDSKQEYVTDTGFKFKFPLKGEWFVRDTGRDHFIFATKPTSDNSTMIAVVQHGPVRVQVGQEVSNEEIMKQLRQDVTEDSSGGRVSNVKTEFIEGRHGDATCLKFKQTGQDDGVTPPMLMSNDGMICLHPYIHYRFIWMAVSQRIPKDKKLPDMSAEENKFFSTLEFQ